MPTQKLRLACDEPYDWPALLRFFAARVIPGVDEVVGSTYRRTFSFPSIAGWFSVTRAKSALDVQITATAKPSRIFDWQIRPLFDLSAPAKHIAAHLSRDERLRPLLKKRPGLRLPGSWLPFELGVRAILGQQVSVAAASTLAGRVASKYGKPAAMTHGTLTRVFPSPEDLVDADLSGVGITTRRAATVTSFARALRDDGTLFSTARSLDSFVETVCALPGFGPWTAQYVAMRLGYPDAFPASDLGVRKALNTTSDKEVLRRAEAWRPYRAYATMHLWASLSD